MDILALIPHRPPFLFVDKVVSVTERGIVAEKSFAPDEPFFAGHFPEFALVPGVLLCESAFQTAAVWLAACVNKPASADPGQPEPSAPDKSHSPLAGKIPVVTRLGDVQFREPVFPGETIRIEVNLEDSAANAYRFAGRISKGNRLVVRLQFTCMLVDTVALRPG